MAFSHFARLVRNAHRRASMRPAPHDLVDDDLVFEHGLTPAQLFARFGA